MTKTALIAIAMLAASAAAAEPQKRIEWTTGWSITYPDGTLKSSFLQVPPEQANGLGACDLGSGTMSWLRHPPPQPKCTPAEGCFVWVYTNRRGEQCKVDRAVVDQTWQLHPDQAGEVFRVPKPGRKPDAPTSPPSSR